ncbi:phosphatase PAP2 family protein [Hymenobacter negativus]|uniref:Phosphatase PAP2 family protein n=1 Tax=Hymenobacter negativus TaxID=2795026 RepID=A0ABS0Q3H0_9BACT|nr:MULTISPECIES: phosphatase PAP2 family protein [Bacteria]MBH8557209.1 phosphatase PAP2 family protein [Hymenobacter negativus]MBH8569501.1 phosphatase PAP2 family protein [Hymenobacter negativus]MBR7209237.1 phosphatase PAP2 family protein [Microvirga sp. STS02]
MRLRLSLFLLALSSPMAHLAQAQQLPALPADSAIQAPRPVNKARAVALRIAVPSALVAVGVLAHSPTYSTVLCQAKQDMQAETQEIFRGFDAHGIDDYSRHAPLALAYGLMATGHRGERSAVGFTLIYLAAHELDEGIVSNLKRITAEPRPYNAQDLSSFPSSHTSQAFLTATLLHEQYGRQYPWVSVSGYAVATATGAMRLMGNKHWATDVLAGAAIGFLSAETVWHLYPALTKALPSRVAHKLLLVPTYVPGAGAGAALAFRP